MINSINTYSVNSLHLKLGQVDLWQAFPKQLVDTDSLLQLTALLTEEDLTEISVCRRESERHTKTVARAFIRSVLSKYTDIKPEKLCFKRSLHGKPEVSNLGVKLSFNLSHTSDIIVCAVTNNADIGIDVERIRFKPSLAKLSETLFNAKEQLDMSSLKGAEQQRRFFDYWTLKESFVKATGAGLREPLNEVGFIPGETAASIQYVSKHSCKNKNWHSWLWPISEQHRLAVTLDKPNSEPTDFRCFYFL